MQLTQTLWRFCLLSLTSARPTSLLIPETSSSSSSLLPEPPVNTTTPFIGPELLLLSRAPSQPQPLLTPSDESIKGRGRQKRQEKFIEKLEEEVADDDNIPILPWKEQVQSWSVDGIPIGATAFWYQFPTDKKATYEMAGLTGCTASLIFSEEGFWAAHHWESQKESNPDGGGTFNARIPPSMELVETPPEIFQKIAVDILDTPPAPGVFRHFESFAELKTNRGDPFADGDNVDIFVLTKAKGPRDKKPRYDDKVKLLEKGYKERIPGAHYIQETYVGDETTTLAPENVRGRILIQYTPYERDDPRRKGCGKLAKLVVWVEDKTTPVLKREWETD
ncbi:hypothetical protein V8F20_012809 [Naviculisporaceae sp. PSN 640]